MLCAAGARIVYGNMNIPQRLEAIRLQKKFTWADLAKALEISSSLLHQVKRGDRNFGPVSIRKLEELECRDFPLAGAADARAKRESILKELERLQEALDRLKALV